MSSSACSSSTGWWTHFLTNQTILKILKFSVCSRYSQHTFLKSYCWPATRTRHCSSPRPLKFAKPPRRSFCCCSARFASLVSAWSPWKAGLSGCRKCLKSSEWVWKWLTSAWQVDYSTSRFLENFKNIKLSASRRLWSGQTGTSADCSSTFTLKLLNLRCLVHCLVASRFFGRHVHLTIIWVVVRRCWLVERNIGKRKLVSRYILVDLVRDVFSCLVGNKVVIIVNFKIVVESGDCSLINVVSGLRRK